jgi:hypothetical protein
VAGSIRVALKFNGNTHPAAARDPGIDESTLLRKIIKPGLLSPERMAGPAGMMYRMNATVLRH